MAIGFVSVDGRSLFGVGKRRSGSVGGVGAIALWF